MNNYELAIGILGVVSIVGFVCLAIVGIRKG